MTYPSTTSLRTAIESQQLQMLRALLKELSSNRFWAPKIRDAGLANLDWTLQDFSVRFPFTTKAQCVADQDANPPYGTNLTYPLERYARFHSTSGTTGRPLRWLDTSESWQWMLESWKCVFRAAGVTAADRAMFAFSFGPFLGFWTAFEAASQMGLLCLPGGGLSSAARLRMLLDNRATVLCCTPTYAIRLAEVAAEQGIDLRDAAVKRIIVAGEPGGSIPATRQHIESLWPTARIFDHHGMTEVGPVTHECPARPCTLRVLEHAYLAEVIDPSTHRAVAAGEVGELVLTTLGRLGSPLLRYRTGDLVRPIYLNETGDDAGPHLCLEGGILGRADDMVLIRGVNVYPSAVDQVVRSHAEVAEYRVLLSTQSAMAQMLVEVEPTGPQVNTEKLAAMLSDAFRQSLSLRVPVKVVECGQLPRYEMKAARWIRQ